MTLDYFTGSQDVVGSYPLFSSGQLILESHKKAKELGHKSIVLLGHDKYYPRFGYEEAVKYGIELPFEVPKENCMVIALVENGLAGVRGMVEYPKEFNE